MPRGVLGWTNCAVRELLLAVMMRRRAYPMPWRSMTNAHFAPIWVAPTTLAWLKCSKEEKGEGLGPRALYCIRWDDEHRYGPCFRGALMMHKHMSPLTPHAPPCPRVKWEWTEENVRKCCKHDDNYSSNSGRLKTVMIQLRWVLTLVFVPTLHERVNFETTRLCDAIRGAREWWHNHRAANRDMLNDHRDWAMLTRHDLSLLTHLMMTRCFWV